MAERTSDRWISIALSVLLHAGIIAVFGYGWWMFRKPPPPPVHALAIQATVVDARAMNPAPPAAAPKPAPPPQAAAPPPPDDTARQAAEQKQAQEKQAAEDQRVAEEKQVADAKRAADERADAEAKQKAEDAAKQKAEAEAKQKVDDERHAEEQRVADAKRQADEKRRAAEAKARADSEADLQRSLAAEEHVMSAESSGALSNWESQIQARIQRAWLRPPSARAGIDCTVDVTQVPGGEVVSAKVSECNGDAAVRESIEAAVFRASPLPPPPDPALFERNLEIHFRPVD